MNIILLLTCSTFLQPTYQKQENPVKFSIHDSVLLFASLKQVNRLVQFLPAERKAIASLNEELQVFHRELNEDYERAVEGFTNQIKSNAAIRYARMLDIKVKELDVELKSKLRPEAYDHVVGIIYQVYGVEYVFSEAILHQRYRICPEQDTKHYLLTDRRVITADPKVRATLRFQLSKKLYDEVFYDNQRKSWDKRIVKPISLDEMIQISIELSAAYGKWK